MLVRCDAIPEPTFLWWDARLQPRFGTLEVRIMDSQIQVADTAAIAALVQCLVRLEARARARPRMADEVLSENRFLAARDGMEARLVEPAAWGRRPVRDRLAELVDACAPVARELGCAGELADVAAAGRLAGRGAAAGAGLDGIVAALADRFV